MFSSFVQPSLVSLFSSTGSDPLGLFCTNTDNTLPSDSFICLLNDETSQPTPLPPRNSITATAKAASPDYSLYQTVLHIQSPTLRSTYIRCPSAVSAGPSNSSGQLGLKHPWIHLQVRNLDREWAFEVGMVDQSGREGIVRCSTFQAWCAENDSLLKRPKLKLQNLPLLLLPLSFPASSARPLTSWATISLHLASLLPHFSSASLLRIDEFNEEIPPVLNNAAGTHVPSGTFSHVSYVKVYANCRLRRIWFSESGTQQRLPWEFQLYAADSV